MGSLFEEDFGDEMAVMTERLVERDDAMAQIREFFPTVPKYIIDHYGAEGFLWLPGDVKTRIVSACIQIKQTMYSD